MVLNPAGILKALGSFGQDKIALALCQWSGVSPHEFQQLLIMNYQFISKLEARLSAIEHRLGAIEHQLRELENGRTEHQRSNGQFLSDRTGGGIDSAGIGGSANTGASV